MSLATFKKKTLHSRSSAVKISGIPTHKSWLYQGPYGTPDSLASILFSNSITDTSNAGFSINGPHRNIGRVGQTMQVSKSATPFKGLYPRGWGGTQGRYPDGPNNISMNITPVITGVTNQTQIIKPSVLSYRGMMQRRFRWIHSGQYPTNWVQPVYTGNQTDSSSQGVYIHKKIAANDIWNDVNDPLIYENDNNKNTCTYTKTLYKPKDCSEYTLRIQRQCANPSNSQKPFPYAVQNGTGVLRGGITVSHVASACHTSDTVTTPPSWYTGK